jgi:hypothetical protein
MDIGQQFTQGKIVIDWHVLLWCEFELSQEIVSMYLII